MWNLQESTIKVNKLENISKIKKRINKKQRNKWIIKIMKIKN
jgi:hypothetical protein